jgi:hypothetical protein
MRCVAAVWLSCAAGCLELCCVSLVQRCKGILKPKFHGSLVRRRRLELCYDSLVCRTRPELCYGALVRRRRLALCYDSLVCRMHPELCSGSLVRRRRLELCYGSRVHIRALSCVMELLGVMIFSSAGGDLNSGVVPLFGHPRKRRGFLLVNYLLIPGSWNILEGNGRFT